MYELLQKYSLSLEQHKKLKAFADKFKIFINSFFNAKVADEIDDLVDLFKIGSGELMIITLIDSKRGCTRDNINWYG